MHLSDTRILHYVEASQTASCHMKTYILIELKVHIMAKISSFNCTA